MPCLPQSSVPRRVPLRCQTSFPLWGQHLLCIPGSGDTTSSSSSQCLPGNLMRVDCSVSLHDGLATTCGRCSWQGSCCLSHHPSQPAQTLPQSAACQAPRPHPTAHGHSIQEWAMWKMGPRPEELGSAGSAARECGLGHHQTQSSSTQVTLTWAS